MAIASLDWLVTAGLDTIVEDRPRRWLAPPASLTPAAPLPAAAAARPALAQPALRPAEPAAGGPNPAGAVDLASLLALLAEIDHPLCQPGIAPRLIDGDTAAGMVVLADQPDGDDSPAARLAERMLVAIGAPAHARAHLLPWQTPAGRAPRDVEVAVFAPWLTRGLDLVRPRLVLALGDRAAARAGVPGNVPRLRGRWLDLPLPGGPVPMLATFHPRSLIGQPELKRLAWADLQTFAERLTA